MIFKELVITVVEINFNVRSTTCLELITTLNIDHDFIRGYILVDFGLLYFDFLINEFR